MIFRLSETVERLELSPSPPIRVIIQMQSGKRHVSEFASFSVGRLEATNSLQLEAAGLTADARGRLRIALQYRTSTPRIFPAGDVIGYPALAAPSSEKGRLAAWYAFRLPAELKPSHYSIGILLSS